MNRLIIQTSMWVAMVVISGCAITPEEEQKPNILFAISDDQSFAHTSFAGCKFINTPAFDRVAREGVYFTNCYAGSPGCAPSRSSIMTGRHHWQNEQSGQHASGWMKKYVPFVDLLKANGYLTGFTGKGVDPFQYARNDADSLWRVENAAGETYNDILYKKGDPTDDRTAGGIEGENYYANFQSFMQNRETGQPFYFWYGAQEPHRVYEQDSYIRNGKKLEDVVVPPFLPDDSVIRGDILDYAVEIEWFDLHLKRILNYLDSIGELENTIVIVTGDNGMPFPSGKANCFEYGAHVPLAISYPGGFPSGRIVNDPVGFADLAPTILEMTGTSPEGMLPISGKSLVNILKSEKSGTVDATKKYVFSGRERHSSSRWENLGYPQRAIRSQEYLFIWNAKPERWPAGAPQAYKKGTSELSPMFGIDKNGNHKFLRGFSDLDASPSKSFVVENRDNEKYSKFFVLAFAKRPEFELYDIKSDPGCFNNLSGVPDLSEMEVKLKTALFEELRISGDPRVVGPDKEIFDSYIRYRPIQYFPKPDWAN